MIKGVDHVGMEVQDLEETTHFYQKAGFSVVEDFDLTTPKATGRLLESSGQGRVELFEFADKDHEYAPHIKHHIALTSNDLKADLAVLVDQGVELTIPVQEFENVTYVFVRDQDGNDIELIERKS